MSTTESHGSIPHWFHPILELDVLAVVATTGPNGEPQASPVWFDWNGTTLLFAVTPETQKLKNMRRDPRLALTIVDPANPAHYLEVRGRVSLSLDDNDRIGNRLARKYLKLDHLPWAKPGDERWIATVTPERIFTMG